MKQNETHRHRCEVRYWIRFRVERGKEWLRSALMDIEKRRGKQAADMLREDIVQQWAHGNRGDRGDWRAA